MASFEGSDVLHNIVKLHHRRISIALGPCGALAPAPMKLSRLGIASVLIFAACSAATLSAQVTISHLGSFDNYGASGTGQSFTPVDAAGTFPTSSAYLTQMQFQVAAQGSSVLPIYLDIYTSLSATVFSGYVGSSTNTQDWESASTVTWNFANLELDKNTTYYAVFSENTEGGEGVYRPTYYFSGTYAGGDFLYNAAVSSGLDAGFSATFNTTAVPEPSTYAAIAGLAVFGLVLLRRRSSKSGQAAVG